MHGVPQWSLPPGVLKVCPIAKLRYLLGKKQLLRGQPPESIAIDVTEIPIEHPRHAQRSLDLLQKSLSGHDQNW
ncbi:hypothetical protein [Nostoc sp.]|uniref:hypothetical protein n=1 Tax=Nostoc sp. TaxID=1180 RepID=UPI002FF847E0